MSLINEALKKAERTRNKEGKEPQPDAKPPAGAEESPISMAAQAELRPRPAMYEKPGNGAPVVIAAVAVVVIAVVAVAIFLFMRPGGGTAPEAMPMAASAPEADHMPPQAPEPALKAPAPAPPRETASAPPPVTSAKATPEPTPAMEPTPPVAAVATPGTDATAAEIAHAEAQIAKLETLLERAAELTEKAETVSAAPPAPRLASPKGDPRVIEFINDLEIQTVRFSATGGKALTNVGVITVGQRVHKETGLRVVGIKTNAITFKDGSGITYIKKF